MIVGIGLDSIEIARVAEKCTRPGSRFAEKMFTATDCERAALLVARLYTSAGMRRAWGYSALRPAAAHVYRAWLLTATLLCTLTVSCDRPPVSPGRAGAPAPGVWSTWQANNQHTGFSPGVVAPQPELLWQYNAPGAKESKGPPVLASDDTAYFTATPGYLYAVDPEGRQRFRKMLVFDYMYGLSTTFTLGPAGESYIGGPNGKFWCVLPDGKIKWQASPADSIYIDHCTITTAGMLIGDNAGQIIALDASGRELWHFDPQCAEAMSSYGPAIGPDGTIYFVDGMTELTALNADGELQWQKMYGRHSSRTSPAIGPSGQIYVIDAVGVLSCFSPAGKLVWQVATDTSDCGFIGETPAIDAEENLYLGSPDGFVRCFRPDGTLKWQTEVDWSDHWGFYHSPALSANGILVLSDIDYRICAVEAATGVVLWTWQYTSRGKPGEFSGCTNPVAINSRGDILVLSGAGELYCLGAPPSTPSP